MKGQLDITISGIDDIEMLAGTPFTKIVSISDADLEAERGYERMLRGLFPSAAFYFSYFDDVEYATDVGPERNEITRILMFSLPFTFEDKILVQCRAGISRSTAIACAIAAQHTPLGQEKKAVQYVRSIRPQMMPNFLIVKLADELLERKGRLIAAVAQVRGPF